MSIFKRNLKVFSRVFSLVFCAFIAIAGGSPAFGLPPFGTAGCGPGSVMMGPRSGQLFAATTNHSTSGQGFAITSGTSNCQQTPQASKQTVASFLKGNGNQLAKDLARGEGETLAGFFQLIDCQSPSLGTIERLAQLTVQIQPQDELIDRIYSEGRRLCL